MDLDGIEIKIKTYLKFSWIIPRQHRYFEYFFPSFFTKNLLINNKLPSCKDTVLPRLQDPGQRTQIWRYVACEREERE